MPQMFPMNWLLLLIFFTLILLTMKMFLFFFFSQPKLFVAPIDSYLFTQKWSW